MGYYMPYQPLCNGGVAGLLSFGNEFAQNVVIFDVDNSLSRPSENRKNNFLVLGEGQTGRKKIQY